MKRPNPALHTDASGLSRPLQGKGRASLRGAGKRERYAAKLYLRVALGTLYRGAPTLASANESQ